jgi:hypothetical protein
MTLPPVLLHEQPVVVLLLERALISWSLAIDERGGHKNLCGSARRSVIPYIHRRTGLYYSSLSSLCEPKPFSDMYEVTPVRDFYCSRSDSYNKSRCPIGGLGAGQII